MITRARTLLAYRLHSIAAGLRSPGYSAEEMAGDFRRENNRFAAAQAGATAPGSQYGFDAPMQPIDYSLAAAGSMRLDANGVSGWASVLTLDERIAIEAAQSATAPGRPRNALDDELQVNVTALRRASESAEYVAAQSQINTLAAQRATWDALQVGAWSNRTQQAGGNSTSTTTGLPTTERIAAHALGVYDAGAGAVEGLGYTFGVVGTVESRATWAVQTAEAAVAGLKGLVSDPGSVLSVWWGNLSGDDPEAIRQATSQGSGIVMGMAGGVAASRLGGIRGTTAGAAFRNGNYVHDLLPRSNLELYGHALLRTPDEAVQILQKIGHDPEMLAKYRFVALSDRRYAQLVQDLGYEFDASYGNVGPRAASVSFKENIASQLADGTQRIPVYVRAGVFESDEAIVQVLSHELHEIENLRYDIANRVSVSEYRNMVRPDRAGNLHHQAVQEGDAWLQRYRAQNKQ